MNAIFGSYDLRSSKQWRDDDMAYREQEIQWLNDEIVRAHEWRNADIERTLRREKLEHEHIVCDARAEQLHTVSEQCALLTGFTVIAMSNVNVPETMNEAVLITYGATATLVIILLLLATVVSTFLLLAVTRYAAHSLEDAVRIMDVAQLEAISPFSSWWLKRCERQQMTAYKFMGVGVVLFFVYLAIVSWIQFNHSTWTSSSISFMCLIGLLTWQLRIASRWRYLLQPPTDHPFTPSRSYAAASVLLTSPSDGGRVLSLRKLSAAGSLTMAPSPVGKLASPSYINMR